MKPNIKDSSFSYLSVLLLSALPSLIHASSNGALTPVAPMGALKNEDSIASPLLYGCPQSCTVLGSDPANWTQIHEMDTLERCKGAATLFAFNIQNELNSHSVIASCSLLDEYPKRAPTKSAKSSWKTVDTADSNAVNQYIRDSGSCGASVNTVESVLEHGNVEGTTLESDSTDDAVTAVKNLASYMADASSCGSTILFSKSGSSVAAMYAGADVLHSSVSKTLKQFADEVGSGAQAAQICDGDSHLDRTVGLFMASSVDRLSDAQRALRTWASGDCVTLTKSNTVKASLSGLDASAVGQSSGITSFLSNTLASRATCRTIQVVKGDGCGSLASRCGISGNDFTKYNSQKGLCSSLKPGQHVCCSPGSLPDLRPKPEADGTCATYTVQPNDNCDNLAVQFGLTRKDIMGFNKGTWGWAGCALKMDQVICLSKGNTPMPAPVNGATCGPQKPGTKKPKGDFTGYDLLELNPCPLNACCSGWGFCGITAEFCTESHLESGGPGAFKEGEAGCISNCGMNITNNDEKPDTFRRVAYFEAFNMKRGCLNMDVREIDNEDLTHVHFAFAGLSEDLDITFDDAVQGQFDAFAELDVSWKKILSFGGWAESTGAPTFQRYKDVVKPENREAFANKVVDFVKKHSLDGVDFDWEYPGATDIPGVPEGQNETENYLAFLKLIKGKLGDDKSLSIALPSSYWYLKPFPVEKMAKYLDYFIFMTYDLHGQWDYGNDFSSPGCPGGNCLRSHINKTETHDALVLVTKAGVPANQVVVGISSYGRSFGMKDPSCTGTMCRFTGSFHNSTAQPGDCTNTGGYISNAELLLLSDNAILGHDGYHAKTWHDDKSDSDIMVYGKNQDAHSWVAYMSDETKAGRIEWVQGLNFGGVSNWAIDLGDWYNGVDPDNKESSALLVGGRTFEGCPSDDWPDTLDELNDNLDKIAEECQTQAVVHVLLLSVDEAVTNYKEVSSGDYDEKFTYYAKWVKDGIDESLDKFMHGTGSKYMDCEWEGTGSSGSGPCTEVERNSPTGIQYVTWKMREEDKFYKALNEEYGIQKDWVEWTDFEPDIQPCTCPLPEPPNCWSCNPANLPYSEYDYNYPKSKDDDQIEVPNPKTVIDGSISNISALSTTMLTTYFDMRTFTLDADYGDVATSFSMPVFMLQEATEQMKNIKKIGGQVEEAEKKELIMDILTIVFMAIPFAGEAAAALGGVAAIARVAFIIGEAGNAALTVVDIIDDPASAPLAIAGLLLGAAAGGRPTRKVFKEAGDARRGMSADALKVFSETFRHKDSIVQNIVRKCSL